MLSMVDLERFRNTPLTREPFEFLIVPEFVKAEARTSIEKDYPEVARPGSFPLREVTYGPAFAKLIEEMRSDEFREAFEKKFNVDLINRPDMITVRGRCSEKDGKILKPGAQPGHVLACGRQVRFAVSHFDES